MRPVDRRAQDRRQGFGLVTLFALAMFVMYLISLVVLRGTASLQSFFAVDEPAAPTKVEKLRSDNSAFASPDSDEFKFVSAVEAMDAETVRKLLQKPDLDVNLPMEGSGVALYILATKPEDQKYPQRSFSATAAPVAPIELFVEILRHPKVDPNGGHSSWSPLKVALSNSHMKMVTALLNHPKTIKEVHVTGLHCDAVQRAPRELAFVVPNSGPDCFRRHPNLITEQNSRLLLRNRNKQSAVEQRSSSSRSSSPRDTSDGKNAKDVHDNVFDANAQNRPPQSTDMIVHPGYFGSIYSALAFYVVGVEIPPQLWIALMVVSAIHASGVVWLVGKTLSMSRAADEVDTEDGDAEQPRQEIGAMQQ